MNALTNVFLSNNDCIDFVHETRSNIKFSITQFYDKTRTECVDKALANGIYMNEIEKFMIRIRNINLQLKK